MIFQPVHRITPCRALPAWAAVSLLIATSAPACSSPTPTDGTDAGTDAEVGDAQVETDAAGDDGGTDAGGGCPALIAPENGSVDASGDTATYTCEQGYTLVGTPTRECVALAWSGEAPTCGVTLTPCDPNPCAHGGVCSLGSGSFSCGCTPGWAGPTCAIADCGPLSAPPSGTVSTTATTQGATATYACSAGTMLVGVSSRVCSSSGAWSGAAPTCQPVDCGGLGSIAHGTVSVAATTFGSTAIYACDDGYVLSGSSMRVCGADRSWSGSVPSCEVFVNPCDPNPCQNGGACLSGGSCDCAPGFEGNVCATPIDCGPLEDPDHGMVSAPVTTFGQTAVYSCANGYELVGVSSRVCGANQAWSDAAPTCAPVSCGPLGDPTHGSVLVTATTFGGVATYTCDMGFERSGLASRMCQSNRMWSGNAPTCTDVDECLTNHGGCDALVTCTNTIGSRTCGACPGGYTGNGVSGCVDIDECGGSPCHRYATCANQPGSYACSCLAGFEGNGTQCELLADEVDFHGEVPMLRRGANVVFVSNVGVPYGLVTVGSGAWSEMSSINQGGTWHGIGSNGRLWGVGIGASGQIGDGTTTNRSDTSMPVAVGAATDWTQVTGSWTASCGLRAPGNLYCWGLGALGFAYPGGVPQPSPTRVGTDSDWTSIEMAYASACGTRGSGELWCFGNPLVMDHLPTRVGTGADWHGLAMQWGTQSRIDRLCGLRSNGEIWCLGNFSEVTGVNTDNWTTPHRIDVNAGFSAIDMGHFHGCGLRSGAMWCWGRNDYGQLGQGTSGATPQITPVRVGAESDWTAVAASAYTTCGVRAGGQVWCWGDGANTTRVFMNPATTMRTTPTRIPYDP